MAAPRLRSAEEQFKPATIYDLFNTTVANFELNKKALDPGEKLEIRSGKLGAGVFGNSAEAVYLVHQLAQQYTGIDPVIMHAYSDAETKEFSSSWDAVMIKLGGKNPTLQQTLDAISQHLTEKATKGK
jgi:hypothetical protein